MDTTELPTISCESDWLDLYDGDRGRLTGKLNGDLKPGDDSLVVSTVDWDLMLAAIPDGYQGPVIKAGTPVEAIVTRTEDGMETTTADIRPVDTMRDQEEPKRFYRHTYQVVVLSESPDHAELASLPGQVEDGPDCLVSFDHVKEEELTGKEAADALYEAGSEPGFFNLDEDGNPQ